MLGEAIVSRWFLIAVVFDIVGVGELSNLRTVDLPKELAKMPFAVCPKGMATPMDHHPEEDFNEIITSICTD